MNITIFFHMKHRIILITIAGILFTHTSIDGLAKNQSIVCISQTIENADQILLEGKLENSGGFRSGGDPIIVEQQDNALFIFFQKNVGLLQVTITGSQGLIYSTSVDTSAPSTLTVSLEGFPSGFYTITFSNEIGIMQGEIEVKRNLDYMKQSNTRKMCIEKLQRNSLNL